MTETALLAWRTIVTMLSLIHSKRGNADPKSTTKIAHESKEQLQILDSLAAVCVRRNEVVAVVAQPDGSGNVQQPLASKFWKFIGFWLAQNPRAAGPKTPSASHSAVSPGEVPPLVDPETNVPQHLKDCISLDHTSTADALLKAFLIHEWPNHQNTMEGTFDIHIWMISKLLGLLETDASSFALYIIAACHAKMSQRLDYRTFNALFKALNDLKTIQFSERTYTPSSNEKKSDETFVTELQDSIFGRELLAKIRDLKLDANDFYTKHTYMIFHELICTLLQEYKNALQALGKLQGSTKKSTPISTTMEALTRVATIGTLVRLMLRGGALKKHLKVIEAFLPSSGASSMPKQEVENEESEFIEAHPPTSSTATRTCLDLLQMMIIYFDAIQTLAFSIQSQKVIASGGSVNIKVLFQPPLGQKELMLGWKELLRNGQYFPTVPNLEELIEFLNPDSDSPSKSNSSAKQAKKKDEPQVSPETVIQSLGRLRDIHTTKDFAAATTKVTEQMNMITKCTSTGSDRYIGSMLEKLQALQHNQQHYNKQQTAGKVGEIIQMVRTLRENARLTDMLRNGTTLDSGVGFTGACHAELILVCYLFMFHGGWNSWRAIGVSKRCCPVCAFLLEYLQFIFTGAHHTIWSCALPEWTPSQIVTEMISHFGGQLNQELGDLKQRTDVLFLPSDHSTGSGRFSASSSVHSLIPIKPLKK